MDNMLPREDVLTAASEVAIYSMKYCLNFQVTRQCGKIYRIPRTDGTHHMHLAPPFPHYEPAFWTPYASFQQRTEAQGYAMRTHTFHQKIVSFQGRRK